MKKLLLSAALSIVATSVFAQGAGATTQDQAAQTKSDQAAQAPTTKPFADYQIGMAFDYPSTWVMVSDPKDPKSKKLIPDSIFGKKSKKKLAAGKQAAGESLFYVPANSRTANLEIYGVTYDHAPEEWETNQVQINNDLKRTVTKQWREQILGVPLLLTKLDYEDAAGKETALVGMVYSRTPYKMVFRLTAPDVDYDAAEGQLRQALQSLRTTTGDLPQPEDPNHPLDKSAYVGVSNKPPKVIVMTAPQPDPAKVKKGEVTVKATVAGKAAVLSMPTGWTADAPSADGSIALHNPAITGTIVVTLASVLDSDPPQAALLKASALSLDEFSKVAKRDETSSNFTTSGASTDTIWREGTGANGQLTTCEAGGATGDMYWLLRYHLAGTPTATEMKAVNMLIDGMSVDPAS